MKDNYNDRGSDAVTAKKFMTFDQQIKFLRDEKKLLIPDEKYARKTLKQITYYSLFAGYKDIFKDPDTGLYKEGTSFNDIVGLYHFDEDLRSALLEYLFKIEDQIKTLVSYYFCEKFGPDQSEYLNSKNYMISSSSKVEIDKMIHIFSNLANKSTEYAAINHARTKHKNVPLWVLVNSMTFGNIYKFYSYLTPDVKGKVAAAYPGINEHELEQFLALLTKFRNVCAHRERLFTHQTNKTIPDMPVHKRLLIPFNEDDQYKYGKNDLYAVVISLYYLLPQDTFRDFKEKLSILFSKYLHAEKVYPETEFLDILGFPENWYEI